MATAFAVLNNSSYRYISVQAKVGSFCSLLRIWHVVVVVVVVVVSVVSITTHHSDICLHDM
jgi:hypothetical protein